MPKKDESRKRKAGESSVPTKKAKVENMADGITSIDKTVASICKGEDKKSDLMMLMSSDCNWDQFLTPAPSAIALLGELILISADTDFSLAEKPPTDGFKLLRYPESFRASLVQVSNAGWSAFNEAHTSMDQIRLHSGNVDQHVKNAVRFLLNGTPAEIKRMVPLALTKVQNIADESLRLATGIKSQFVEVMELTGELLAACTMTRSVHEDKLKETEIAIKVAQTQKEANLAEIKEAEEKLQQMDNAVREAQEDFKDAIKSIPSGMELVGIALGESLVDGIRTITSIPNLVKSKVQKTIKKFVVDDSDSDDDDEDDDDDGGYEMTQKLKKVCKEIPKLEAFINELVLIAAGQTDKNNIPCPDWDRISKGELEYVKQSIKRCSDNVVGEIKSKLLERTFKLCTDALDVCDSLKRMEKSMIVKDKEDKISETITNAKTLQREAQKLASTASRAMGKNPLDNKSPNLAKMPNESSSQSAVKAAVENARYKTELAKETLKDAKRRQEESSKELRESNKELTKVLMEMARLDLKKIDFETIRTTLIRGMKALANVRDQWEKLVRFFQMLSNLIKCCLHTSLTNFVEQAKEGRELKMGDPSTALSNVFKDIIFEQASKASQVAHVVRAISGTYVKISNEHLMDRITGLGHLVALDPKSDESEIYRRRKELHKGCRKAQEDILKIVQKEKREFNEKIDERICKIVEIQEQLPAIDPEREQEIKQSVSEGFNDDELDDLI